MAGRRRREGRARGAAARCGLVGTGVVVLLTTVGACSIGAGDSSSDGSVLTVAPTTIGPAPDASPIGSTGTVGTAGIVAPDEPPTGTTADQAGGTGQTDHPGQTDQISETDGTGQADESDESDDGATPGEATTTSVTFESCADAHDAGKAPIYVGDPGYSRKLDRDADGIACEPEDGGTDGGTEPAG